MKNEINLILYKQDGTVHLCSDELDLDIEGDSVRSACQQLAVQMEDDWKVFREIGHIPPMCDKEFFRTVYKSLFQGEKVFG